VAQVHRAVLWSGEAVAVKVQRPRTAQIFDADLHLLARLAAVVDVIHPAGETPLSEMAAEFARFTQREADFLAEARTAERLRAHAGPHERLPRIIRAYCTRRVLTLELMTMPSVAQLLAGSASLPLETIRLCLDRIAHASMRQLFVDGFFHADPHPGNVLFSADGTVGLLDFGIFGGLTGDELDAIAGFIENLALGNLQASVRHYERMSSPTARSDRVAFARETRDVFAEWYRASAESDTPRERRHIAFYWGRMMAVFRRHHIRMNLDLLLFWRAVFALSATALRLDPEFDLLDHVRRFFRATRPPAAERVRFAAAAVASPETLLAARAAGNRAVTRPLRVIRGTA
jgi:ubiquinone biosynthesis protein